MYNDLKAARILSEDYPEVFSVGSFIYGLPGDTPADIRAICRCCYEMDLDMIFYIPLTPLPGTPYWKPAQWDPTGEAFRSFDFLPGLDANARHSRLAWSILLHLAFWWPLVRLRVVFMVPG